MGHSHDLHRRGRSFTVPNCSKCGNALQRNDAWEWFCLSCADEWLRAHLDAKLHGESVGGAVLPPGVADPRRSTASFSDVFPNRASRRRARKAA